jgi:hypothetical protein
MQENMDNQVNNSDSEVNQDLDQVSPISTDEDHKSNNNLLIIISFISFVFILLGTYLWFSQNKEVSQVSDSDVMTDLNTSIEDQVKDEVITKVSNKLLYIKDPNLEVQNDLQTWVYDWENRESSKLDLTGFSRVYKYPDSNIVYYQSDVQGDDKFYVKNLETEEIKSYKLIDHPQEDVRENATIRGLNSIAPDGSAIVFNTFFTEPCPPFSPPPGFQGGFGPCEPDPNEDFPGGDYIYRVDTGESYFLSDHFSISRWDLENNRLFFISQKYQENGLYIFDLDTNKVSLVDKSETFGYGAFPFLKSNKIVKIEATTGDDGKTTSMSKISLVDTDTKEEIVIDNGRWAEIQPFASIAPDEKSFIYYKTDERKDGHSFGNLYLYGIESGQSTKLTETNYSISYSIKGNWIDGDNFVTSVNLVNTENYTNVNNYLVNINIKSGEIERLTPKDDVYRFNNF